MGQSSSSLRDQQPEDPSRVTLPSPLDGNGPRRSLSTQEMPEEPVGNQTHRDERSIRSRNSIFNLLSEPSTTTMPPPPALVNQSTSNASSSFSDDLRTLPVPVPQQRTRHHSAASRILSRRQSTMSRLGTRILPNSVIRGLLSSEEETAAEGQAHRNGRIIRPIPRTEILHNPSRFSPFNPLGSRGANRRRSIRGPYPLPRGDAALIPDSPPNQSDVDSAIDGAQGSDRGWRRSPRLNRVRQSLSTPISHIFGSPSDLPESTDARSPPSLRLPLSIELMNNLFPRSDPMDMHMDLDRPPTSDLEQQSMADMQPISSLPLPRPAPGLGPGPIRRLPGIIRTRSPQLPRREEQTPLSRVLQVAAAAIAAQLSGNNTNTAPNMQPLGDEGFDASLESLFQSLQQVTSAQENHIGGPGPQDPSQPRGSSPLNFLRVFRFTNGDGAAGRAANGEAEHPDLGGSDEDGIEGRTVTLVVVGVRSVPSNRPLGNPQDSGDIGLDTLLGLPHHPPTNSDNTFQDANFAQPTRPTDRISRLPSSFTRPDMNPSADTMNSGHHHHHRSTSGRLRESLDMMASPALSSVLVDSPPGPYPPPSTPAEVSTTLSSGNSSPSRRPSSASAMAPNFLPQVHEDPAQESAQANSYAPTAGAGVRQRRRSDSEFARHRQFGAGSARRHGVVEPDQPSTPGGRTWVIYVVGTNLSENHPAFATPSLFTDNPTYEDMILLSSLLGPAKPPVASQADVSSSGGLFRLVEYAGLLVAEAYEGGQSIDIGETERCLICLSDYEAAEDIRQLTKCKHLYHKDCIDQWLTTGRNSCPLCRGQGVTESSSSGNSMPAQQPSI